MSVPTYDFDWQVYYELQTPKSIPAGSKVTVTTLFDNSANNKYNPAPELLPKISSVRRAVSRYAAAWLQWWTV